MAVVLVLGVGIYRVRPLFLCALVLKVICRDYIIDYLVLFDYALEIAIHSIY